MIYFVQRADNAVKIGYTDNPARRFKALTRDHGHLEVLGIVDGNTRQERALHKLLEQFRIEGEWFKPSAAVMSAILEPVPPPDGKKMITITIDGETHADLKVLAKADGRVLLEYLKRLLTAHARKVAK